MKKKKQQYLKNHIEHVDITKFNVIPMIEAMGKMAFQARNLYRASLIYDKMLADKDCTIMLCLAGSLISAGLKDVIYTMIQNNMVDVIIATGANIVDQDFFEALGFKHYIGTAFVDDNELRKLHIDRIYDTYIDEDKLRICDEVIGEIADSLEQKPYSSREFMIEMGKYLTKNARVKKSITLAAYRKGVPIFIPAFSDCSAGFGLVLHQHNNPKQHVAIDSAKDFLELTRIKIQSVNTGLVMVGGGVPKNFAQDVVIAAEVLGKFIPMHKYAIQLTVADERDGGLSGSTLREANSWGKVDTGNEQMVFGEATITFPLIISYVYHKGSWKKRKGMRLNNMFEVGPKASPVKKHTTKIGKYHRSKLNLKRGRNKKLKKSKEI